MSPNKTDPLRALSDPIRISLFELIKEGMKTTPELAEILNENRINLYHHLKVLEQAGLITSSYNEDRIKVYRAHSNKPEITHIKRATMIKPELPKMNRISTVVLSPPTSEGENRKFKHHIREAAKLSGSNIPSKYEILQVQVMTEEERVYNLKQTRSTSVKRKRSNSKN